MSNTPKQRQQPTQKTLAPEEKERIDIPIPKRKDVFQALKNATKKPSRSSRPIK
jgi:hypothetical protein